MDVLVCSGRRYVVCSKGLLLHKIQYLLLKQFSVSEIFNTRKNIRFKQIISKACFSFRFEQEQNRNGVCRYCIRSDIDMDFFDVCYLSINCIELQRIRLLFRGSAMIRCNISNCSSSQCHLIGDCKCD